MSETRCVIHRFELRTELHNTEHPRLIYVNEEASVLDVHLRYEASHHRKTVWLIPHLAHFPGPPHVCLTFMYEGIKLLPE